ncbi:MAG: ubiquinol-cytochrome c reductase iron-sulfur subunit [Planctomycetes bacterium]|nr:ubiquinol-cytochrome c reductase iron-sulfur subunit [Planctomycetota bacterium]
MPPEADPPDRRRFLSTVSTLAMTAGLLGGYGAFGAIAARFLYPAGPRRRAWMFVVDLASMKPGDSRSYVSPAGESVALARTGNAGTVDDFIALSSTCPHLGCQVHWEAQNSRFFCPCHNGTFDPSGRATGGPPADAGQSLLKYPLKVEGGLLYIEVPVDRVG